LDATVVSCLRHLSTWTVWKLTRMRLGAYQRLAQQEMAEARWKGSCPFCDEHTPEDLAHLLALSWFTMGTGDARADAIRDAVRAL
jgi:hypothetical protein